MTPIYVFSFSLLLFLSSVSAIPLSSGLRSDINRISSFGVVEYPPQPLRYEVELMTGSETDKAAILTIEGVKILGEVSQSPRVSVNAEVWKKGIWTTAYADNTLGDRYAISCPNEETAIQVSQLANNVEWVGPLLSGTIYDGVPQPPPTGLWRPFSDDSIWNTKIPANAKIHPNSDKMIAHLKSSSYSDGGHFSINIYSWSVPVYDAYADTPRVTIYRDDGSVYYTNVPMPKGAQADPQEDRHMCVVDWDNKVEWDFFNLRWEANQWRAHLCRPWDLYGSGVNPNRVWGCRGSSVPLLAGLIRPEEIEAGVIPHALVFAYWLPRRGWKVYPPAATTDGKSDDIYAIREGARIQLDPNLNLDTIPGLTRAGKIIAKCMQDYGIICVDCAGGIPLYAENPLGRETDPWPALGFTGSVAKPIPPYFRVIDYAVFGAVEEPF